MDSYCASTAQKIRMACECPDADVFFLVGGTQTNETVIATMLRPYEGVLCAQTGHIAVHESGAVEYTGHKALTLEGKDGKISAEQIRDYVSSFYAVSNHEHMVFPGMVYISHPTEYGTLYSLNELTKISEVCHAFHLPLFLDGARLGYGLMSRNTDVTLADIARLCDVFYIGGTKVGALCGEAVVFQSGRAPAHFITMVKQHGAMLAKGRLLGIQFDTLFTNHLYEEISNHAIEMAESMKSILHKHKIPFFLETETNQQFVTLKNTELTYLSQHLIYSTWEPVDAEHTAIRLCTSWATDSAKLEELDSILANMP
jgi:threonine aldolase